jgi:ElaB/YqjD/DUF883 family membrane-anchored ribosome-binding protein
MPDHVDARDRLVKDLRVVLADTEELLRAVGTESKDKIATLRPRLEVAVQHAKTQIADLEAAVETRARAAVRDVDTYAHENPWTTAGVAAGVGAALGAIIGVLLARH